MADSPWPMIHTERRALLDDVSSLTPGQWDTQSLCADWTVREVFGHLTASAQMTPTRFIAKFAGAGFNFNKMVAGDVARQTAVSTTDQVAALRRLVEATNSPPGPTDAMLGENVVHAEDIRRPLGIERAYPVETMMRTADFYKASNPLIGSKNRIAGLKLRATDVDWSTGDGPEVRGPMISLLLAMTGRRAALADLSGGGVATLTSRT